MKNFLLVTVLVFIMARLFVENAIEEAVKVNPIINDFFLALIE